MLYKHGIFSDLKKKKKKECTIIFQYVLSFIILLLYHSIKNFIAIFIPFYPYFYLNLVSCYSESKLISVFLLPPSLHSLTIFPFTWFPFCFPIVFPLNTLFFLLLLLSGFFISFTSFVPLFVLSLSFLPP